MAVTFNLYDDFKSELLKSTVDLDGDTIKVMLGNSSMTYTSTHTVNTDVNSNEVANGNGYTTGGATLSNKVANQTSGTGKWDADDVSWTASGGSIAAANAVIYSTTNSNKLIGHIAFGATSTAGDGTQFIIRWNASGILTLA